ncbi:MAG: polysaccharide deacetylase family protein, partial [Parvularculaceae bacterium]|nr:polysaccharide deacetylase family protein [Parvularculaceae bacterium]
SGQEKRLLASVHDVSPREFGRLRDIDRFFEEVGVGPRYAMLVVPNFWREWPIAAHRDFVAWLRDRAEAGVEMILHGLFHLDTTPPSERNFESRMRHRIFGEGEFAMLGEGEADRRLREGRDILENALGRPIASFIAPSWQYSRGAHEALRRQRFKIAEGRFWLWSPETGKVISRTPVIAYSNRTAGRRNSSLLWSRAASHLLARDPLVRHAIHPGDFDSDALKAEIRRSLGDLLETRRAVSYASLIENAV